MNILETPAGTLRQASHSAFRTCRSGLACRAQKRGAPIVISAYEHADASSVSRRSSLLQAAAVVIGSRLFVASSAHAGDAAADKITGLTADQMLDRIKADFQEKQYYVTGNLSPQLFTDDCYFVDPTVQVTGWKFYTNAVKTLFDADQSRADIRSIKVLDDRHIELKWRLEGQIKPWFNAPIKPYTGTTIYVLNNDGLISEHLESWDTSAVDVFASVFLPNFGAPPAPPV